MSDVMMKVIGTVQSICKDQMSTEPVLSEDKAKQVALALVGLLQDMTDDELNRLSEEVLNAAR